jgi:hypothetical protein
LFLLSPLSFGDSDVEYVSLCPVSNLCLNFGRCKGQQGINSKFKQQRNQFLMHSNAALNKHARPVEEISLGYRSGRFGNLPIL